MSYEKFHRKGTSRERQIRALQLESQLRAKVEDAQTASDLADKLGQAQDHIYAAKAWRRTIYPATRLDQDTTNYREAVRRHMDTAQMLLRGLSAQ